MRKKALLMMQTLQLVHGPTAVDEQMFRNAMEALRALPAVQCTDGVIVQSGMSSMDIEHEQLPVSCPERTMKGGRPLSTGLKAWLSRNHKKRISECSSRDPLAEDWPEEERPDRKKTRRIIDI